MKTEDPEPGTIPPPLIKSGKLFLVSRDGKAMQTAFTANEPTIIRNGKRYAFGVSTRRGTFYYELP